MTFTGVPADRVGGVHHDRGAEPPCGCGAATAPARWLRAWSSTTRETRRPRVLVLGVLPGLHERAVADMADEHALVLKGLAPALAARDVHRHGVLVVGDDVVELDPEGARGALHRPGEEVEDVIHATMIPREGAPAGRMPDGVWIIQRTQGVDVAFGERVEALADQLLVGMGHGSSLPHRRQREPTTRLM